MALDELPKLGDFLLVFEAFQYNHFQVAVFFEVAGGIPDVGDASAHPGREIASGGTQNDHPASGHVLAAVISHSFDHSSGSGVAHTESLGSPATEVGLSARGTVKDHVSYDDILLGQEPRGSGRVDDQSTAGKTLAHIIVGIAFQLDGDPFDQPGPQALTRRSVEAKMDCSIGQTLFSPPFGDLVAEHGAHGTVDISDGHLEPDLVPLLEGPLAILDQLVIQSLIQSVILRGRTVDLHLIVRLLGGGQDGSEVQAVRFPV